MKKRHINIPIFIPHEGCPNDCVFCNQRSITCTHEKADRDIIPEIDSCLATIENGSAEVEIAFFGGSFTGIDRGVMTRLLSDAHEYIKCGRVSSIRISTRPDFIDCEILQILSKYGVRHIELGIQSMDDTVLLASRRGHTALQSEKACALVTAAGFSLTGQMMVGLPKADEESEKYTAKRICEMGADSARIYPCVVFYDTPLCDMARSGVYTPITDEEGAKRASECLNIFEEHGVKILRIGLQSGEGLSADKVYAGASHSAIGEMAISYSYFLKIQKELDALLPEICVQDISDTKSCCEIELRCRFGEASKVSGQCKINKSRISEYLAKKGLEAEDIRICESKRVYSKSGIDVRLTVFRKPVYTGNKTKDG